MRFSRELSDNFFGQEQLIERKTMKSKSNPILVYIFAIAPFLAGLSQHYQIYIVTIISIILLLSRRHHSELKSIDLSVFVPLIIILISSAITIVIGVSSGDSVYGFMNVVSAILFIVVLKSFSDSDKDEAFRVIPYVGAVMTVVTIIAYTIPGIRDLIWVNGRLGGTFGYPNTFALYLLIGLYIYLNSIGDKRRLIDYIVTLVLLVGIFLTGSRSVFVMTIILSIYVIIIKKNTRKIYIPVLIGVVVIVGIYILVSNDLSSVGRFLTISTQSSTFLGRILYDVDAVKMILNRPFGHGYLGYYFVEPFMQSGVYSVRFVHNDWLQTALDYGVISLLALGWLYGLSIYRANSQRRIILILIGVHMLFDFDLQFFSILLIAMLCVSVRTNSDKDKGVIKLRGGHLFDVTIIAPSICCMIMCVWLGVADFIGVNVDRQASLKLYPWANDVKLHAMAETEDIDLQREYAAELQESVPYIGSAYDVLSQEDLDNGNVLEAIANKHKAVIYQKYNITKYEEYANMLRDIMDRYKGVNDEIYHAALDAYIEIPDMLQSVEDETSSLAYKINDVPNFNLSNDY